MEEKNKNNEFINHKNIIIPKLKNNYKYEVKKKYISQNPLLSSKNNSSTNDTYLNMNKYIKPFNTNFKNIENKNSILEKDNNYQNNQNLEDNNFNDKRKNILEDKNYFREKGNKCINNVEKDEEELVTSFEKKPSEILSPKTISEDSFLTEISNYTHNQNLNDEKDNNEEDIVNYEKQDCFQNLDKNENSRNYNNKEKEDQNKKNLSFFNKFNNNKKLNDYKMNAYKKTVSETFCKDKKNNKLKNNELKENYRPIINEYNQKKKKTIIKKENECFNQNSNYDKEININEKNNFENFFLNNTINEKNNCENAFLNNTINKNKRHLKNKSNLEKNSIFNISNIYIPVNQRKNYGTNKKIKGDTKEEIFDTANNINKKNILFNSTELNYNIKKQLTNRLESIKKIKHNKNDSIVRKNNNDSIGISKNILNNINNDQTDKEEKRSEIVTSCKKENHFTNNNNSFKDNKCLKYNKNTVLKKSYIKIHRNFENKISFLENKFDKLNITNINFYKNKTVKSNNKNKSQNNNNKLFLSIDELNDIKKIKNTSDVSKVSTFKSRIIYEPKKPSRVKSKNKNNKQLLYNRASYDPNNSNYNLIRKKKLLKQCLTSIDLLNKNDKNNMNLNNVLNKHIRNNSGVSYYDISEKSKKNNEFNPNKLRNIIKNKLILNNNNSHSIDRNSVNMKIINSLSRSYESNFYPKLNKNMPNTLNDKNLDLKLHIIKNKDMVNNNINKTPRKTILNNNTYLNHTIRENDKRKLNIFANNINNINNYLDINDPILKYNNRTNKDNFLSQTNNINIINTNNNKNYINKERMTFFPQQRNLSLELDNQFHKINTLNIHNYQNQPNLISFNNNNNLFENNELYNLRQSLNNNNSCFGVNLNLLNYLNQQKINGLIISINIEDLILLLEKFNNIIFNFNNNKRVVNNECFEFWNYYYNSSLYCQLEKLYINNLDSNTIRISINYCLMSIIILYDYSFEINTLKNEFVVINNILKLNYMNLMLISEHTLKIISSPKMQMNNNNNLYNNFLILKLYNIIDLFRKRGGFNNDFIEIKSFTLINDLDMTNIEKISYNTNLIIQYLRYILKNYQTSKNDVLTSFFKKIKEKTYEEINAFFRDKIYRIVNKKASFLSSIYLNNLKMNNLNSNSLINKFKFRTLPAPYLRTKNNKNYSLVLDLDETLIHFKQGNSDEEGVVRIRPGINKFLEEVGKLYELIIFTTSTQEYADLLIDSIEEDKIYFDHRLYREHTIIIDNNFVKDLTRIGRPIDKIIIIDDNPENFKLQKENGIVIKPFYGKDDSDKALYNLIPILKSIAIDGKDVRVGLNNYKNDILKNITSDGYN